MHFKSYGASSSWTSVFTFRTTTLEYSNRSPKLRYNYYCCMYYVCFIYRCMSVCCLFEVHGCVKEWLRMIHALYSWTTAALEDPVRWYTAKWQGELLSRGEGNSLGVGHLKIKAPAHPGWRLSVRLKILPCKTLLLRNSIYKSLGMTAILDYDKAGKGTRDENMIYILWHVNSW
jgi:hypothetical protein